MAGRLNTLSIRMFVTLLVIHAVTLPLLFFGLRQIVHDNLVQSFIDDARNYAHVLAGTFEADELLFEGGDVVAHLDGAMLGGRMRYAALEYSGELVLSSLLTEEEGGQFVEDFGFGENGDDSYNLSVPFGSAEIPAVLRLGFDETVTTDHIAQVNRTVLLVLMTYVLASSLIAILVSTRILKPIKTLQRVSREVMSGSHGTSLSVDTGIYEIHELAEDLEAMRSRLVGLNKRLQEEIVEREAAEAGQRELESRLRHAQRLESLGTLAGGVAHEFNNVLQPLLMYTELAIEDIPEDSSAREDLGRVLRLAHDAKGLSQQILTFGRTEKEAQLERVDLAPVVEEALAMVTALLPATTDISGVIESSPLQVRADARQVQQLIVNLCSNAFQSLTGGTGSIRVRCYEEDVTPEFAARHARLHCGKYAVIEVADSGKGMDDATINRIFEPFFTKREVGEGTGLGLSVVHGIVTQHDGDIIVDSEPGAGSIFRVYLPELSGQERLNLMEANDG